MENIFAILLLAPMAIADIIVPRENIMTILRV
jgi:hypothetical protein